MKCDRIAVPGGGVMWVCGGRPRRFRCAYCRGSADRLCDHPVGEGKACDRKLCREHAHSIGEDRDLCPDHVNAREPRERAGLVVCTGNVNMHRCDPDAFDVSRMSGGPAGAPFAPSVALLKWGIAERRRAEEFALAGVAASDPAEAERLSQESAAMSARAWKEYRRAYLAEMLISSGREVPPAWAPDVRAARDRGVVEHAEAWTALQQRHRVVLLCYCRTRERCHRGVLVEVLTRSGAVDGGELGGVKDSSQLGLFAEKGR